MATTLKRTRTSTYSATLAAKNEPANWAKPTLLLHFVEQSHASTVFVATDAARHQFLSCEVFRIYLMDVPGKCVRNCSGEQKYGVKATYEVTLKYPCKKLLLSKEVWPFAFPYNFVAWPTLNQASARTFVDLFGTVMTAPVRDVNTALSKLVVTLGNGDMKQEVFLLGALAATSLTKGDNVAFSGLSVCEYAGERTLQTAFLSVIEINASLSHIKTCPYEPLQDGPKRKAIRLAPRNTITVSEAQRIAQQQLRDAEVQGSVSATEFSLVGTLTLLTDDFFTQDPPLLETDAKEVMCWKTELQDQTGQLQVKIWDKPCYELFQVTADKMRSYWEDGNDHEDRRLEILGVLNAQLGLPVTCNCKAVVWTYGQKERRHESQINVNSVEVKYITD